MHPLISIVITTYKRRAEQIEKAIYSVLNQSYENIELIIVDDSPDSFAYRNEVKEFCEGIQDNRVVYIQHKKNSGACIARNTGLDNSKGEFIAFLDDDAWRVDKLEKQYSIFEGKTNELGIVYSNATIHEASGKIRYLFDKSKPYRGNVYNQLSCNNFIGSTSFPLIRKTALTEVGGFDACMPASQDWETWLRICKLYTVDYIDEPLIDYYIYQGERITSDTKRRIKGLIILDSKQKDLLDENMDVRVARRRYELRLYIQCEDFKNAVRCYGEIIKSKPLRIFGNLKDLMAFGRFIIKRSEGKN